MSPWHTHFRRENGQNFITAIAPCECRTENPFTYGDQQDLPLDITAPVWHDGIMMGRTQRQFLLTRAASTNRRGAQGNFLSVNPEKLVAEREVS
jgi:hypothetical protein